VSLEGGVPFADVEWTPKGEQQIRDKEYLFISPTFGPFKDETGGVHENTLMGAALTNKPFLNMPAISLASDERVSLALDQDPAARFYQHALDGDLGDQTQALVMLDVSQAERDQAHSAGNSLPDKSYPINNAKQLHAAAILAASGHGDVEAAKTLIRRRARELSVDVTTLPGFGPAKLDAPSDSRAPMAFELDTDALVKTLGLDDTADEQKVLDAIADLQKRPETTEPAEPTKTLEQQAQDAGMVILDAEQVGTLRRQAAAGEAAQKQLHQQRFDTTFSAAVKDRRVKPADEERFQKLYQLDADTTIDLITNLEAAPTAKPAGDPAIELDRNEDAEPEELAAHGIHPGNHQLHARIQKHLLDNKLPQADYAKVLDQYTKGAIAL
jgi:phage I-like protein